MVHTVYLKTLKCVVLVAIVAVLNGCAMTSTSGSDMSMPPVSNKISSHTDIVLPSDLEYDSSKSMAIKTDSFNGGIYHYSGRLEFSSLKDFIIASMGQNKWKLVGEAAYKSTMLAFMKPNKTCMVTLTEGFGGILGTTHVELYVTHDLAASKGLNPFGEPVKN